MSSQIFLSLLSPMSPTDSRSPHALTNLSFKNPGYSVGFGDHGSIAQSVAEPCAIVNQYISCSECISISEPIFLYKYVSQLAVLSYCKLHIKVLSLSEACMPIYMLLSRAGQPTIMWKPMWIEISLLIFLTHTKRIWEYFWKSLYLTNMHEKWIILVKGGLTHSPMRNRMTPHEKSVGLATMMNVVQEQSWKKLIYEPKNLPCIDFNILNAIAFFTFRDVFPDTSQRANW